MRYEKPQIEVLETALNVVQDNGKGMDSIDTEPSNPAYQADE